ncbi:hypothetical protein MA16_Dca027695 [Dendrobium catenatum]|uniref:Uncharacterized protein n=1 Tax=Dendrobium catenatum TaxID=906689 RepID=A0A2I0W2Z0_9ASPA|nr:hypothetical protein MA16_Dca027695 [Dendrobium catenatum]
MLRLANSFVSPHNISTRAKTGRNISLKNKSNEICCSVISEYDIPGEKAGISCYVKEVQFSEDPIVEDAINSRIGCFPEDYRLDWNEAMAEVVIQEGLTGWRSDSVVQQAAQMNYNLQKPGLVTDHSRLNVPVINADNRSFANVVGKSPKSRFFPCSYERCEGVF